MILVNNAPGGLYLRRDDTPALPPLFVRTEELAALLTDIMAASIGADTLTWWDMYAALSGNPAAARPPIDDGPGDNYGTF